MEIPFVGGAYEQRSLSINAQRSINCFPVVDKQDAASIVAMYGTPGLKYFAQATMYGSGADGAVTISVNTTLTRDMQYSALTVNAGITLDTAGFTVLCSGILTNGGVITDTVSGGSGGTGGTGYGDPGKYGSAGSRPGAGSGGDGGAGGGTVGVGGTGGKGGGVVKIHAKTLTNNGTIHANGSDATAPSGEGGYGANGGNGGTVSLFYDARTAGTVTALAGGHSNGLAYGIDSYTKLLINCDGVNGSTTFTDISASGHTVTAEGTVTVSTSGPKFGTGSAIFPNDASENYLSVPDHADWNFGSGDFTLEMQAKSSDSIIGMFGQFASESNYWYLVPLLSLRAFRLAIVSSGVGALYDLNTSSEALPLNVWRHLELSRSGGYLRAFIDGYLRYELAISQAMPDIAAPLTIGSVRDNYYHSHGYKDVIRVSKGIARHTDNFTVPPEAYRVAGDGADGSAGTTVWTNIPYAAFSSAVFRGGMVVGTTMYMCVGANIISVPASGVVSLIGSITTTTGNVFMDSNGTHILIVDGTAFGHYITIAAGTLHDIADADFPSATSCTFMDGYFIVTKASTGEIYISGLYDVTAWDALDYATAEGRPDNALRVIGSNNTLWIFGTDTTEVFYNTGATDFPFARINGALLDKGLGATASVVLLDNSFCFLSHEMEILRSNGYQFEKISTIHIDKMIQGFTTISDAVGYKYKIDGHTFYVLTFPTADKTLVYDLSTGFWHEWQSYKTQGVATFGRHRGAIGFYCNKKNYVGDYSNGRIYELDMETYTDDGELIKRTRRAQTISKDKKRIAYHEINLEFETGVGIGGVGSGSNPQVGLTWSTDGGNTWATVQSRYLGESANYSARQKWNRLGTSRNRIFELTMYEPVKFVLLSASAILEECNS